MAKLIYVGRKDEFGPSDLVRETFHSKPERNISVETIDNAAEAVKRIEQGGIDMAICHWRYKPDQQTRDLLADMHKKGLTTPVIVLIDSMPEWDKEAMNNPALRTAFIEKIEFPPDNLINILTQKVVPVAAKIARRALTGIDGDAPEEPGDGGPKRGGRGPKPHHLKLIHK